MSTDAASDRPCEGDLVITQQHASGTHVVSQYPSPAQITTTSRGAALDVARRFARHEQVDVWIVAESGTTRVSRHRRAVQPR